MREAVSQPRVARPLRRADWWLFRRFLARELRTRFMGSVLGVGWALIHPVALLLVFALVFSYVFKVRLPPGSDAPFLLFVAVALWPWLAFQESLTKALSAVTANAALVKKVPFAHELLVYASIAASFALNLAGYALVLVMLHFWGYAIAWRGIPLACLVIVGVMLLTVGLTLVAAAVHVFVRDLEQGLAHALALMFYATPIIYSITMVPPFLADLMRVNPFTTLLEACRAALLTGRAVPTLQEVAVLAACLVMAVAGRWFFRRLSPHFEDVL